MPTGESIEVEVKLLPPLNNTAGRQRVKLALAPGADLQGVLEALLRKFPSPKFRLHLYDTEGRLVPAWCAFVNGKPVPLRTRQGLAHPVADGDEISFLLNLAGG